MTASAEQDLRFCVNGGYLGPWDPGVISDDPSDCNRGGGGWFCLLCNRLACRMCGESLRAERVLVPTEEIESLGPDAFFEHEDWLALPGSKVSDSPVTYACRCRSMKPYTTSPCSAEHLDWDEQLSHPVPSTWRCSGHPPSSLPIQVDGALIGQDSDIEGLVQDFIYGDWVPESPAYLRSGNLYQWPGRLYARLEEFPDLARRVSQALFSLAVERDDHRAVGAALWFLWGHGQGGPPAGCERLIAFFEEDCSRVLRDYPREPSAGGGRGISLPLVVLSPEFPLGLPSWPHQAADLRGRLEGLVGPDWLLDPDCEQVHLLKWLPGRLPDPWVIENVVELAGHRPALIGPVLSGLKRRSDPSILVMVATALARSGRGDLLRLLEEWLEDRVVDDEIVLISALVERARAGVPLGQEGDRGV